MAKGKGSKKSAKKDEVEFLSVKSPRSSRKDRPISVPTRWVAFGLFALVTVIFFGSHLLGTAFLWEDFTEQYLPFQTYAASMMGDGNLPFWNPYTFSGMPFFADLQNGVLYPGHLVSYALSGGDLSVWLAQALVIVHYFFAMVGAWLLAGLLGVRGWGRIFAGIGFGLSGIMVAQMIHPNMIFHMAWFPTIVALYWGGLRHRSMLSSLTSGLLFGLVMLSGHPQSALYILFFLLLVTLYELIAGLQVPEEKKSGLFPALAGSFVSMLLAGGIFMVQYLPSSELADLSQRAEMTYEASVDGSLEPRQLLTLVAPEFFGVVAADPPDELPFWLRGGGDRYYFWETVIYVGISTLILALLGVAGGVRRKSGWFLLGCGVLGLLFGMGDHFFVHPILGSIPPFDTFRIPARMGLFFALAMPLLAGRGLDLLIAGKLDSKRGTKVIALGGGLILFVSLLMVTGALNSSLGVPPQLADAVTTTALPPFLFALLTVGVIWAGLRGKIPAAATAVALLLMLVVDLFTFGIGMNQSPTNPEDQLEAIDSGIPEFRPTPPDELFRVQMRGIGNYGGAMLTLRNQGPYSKFMLIEGYNPLVLQRAYPKTAEFEDALALMNVKYAIEVDSATGAPRGFRSREYRYDHARLVFNGVVVAPDHAEQMMTSGTVDFGTTVLLEEEPGVSLGEGGSGTAVITSWSPDHISIRTSSSDPSVLVLSEVWYPAWKATVDGEPQKVLRANWSQRGIALPAGEHTVELHYDSDRFSTGRLIALISLVLLLGGIGFLWYQRKRKLRQEVEEGDDL